MAVLFVKSLVFPRDNSGRYTRLQPGSPTTDVEFGSSTANEGMTSTASENSERNHTIMNEKSPVTNISQSLLPARINPRIISDATIGLSDGLTVPFALTAGLSALGDTHVVIYGGFAELIAGGISMGLGGYLGAKSETEAYHAALSETKAIVTNDHLKASAMVRETFEKYDFSEQALESMVASLQAEPYQMIDFIMRFHHQLAEADFTPSKAYVSGLTISLGYFLGGLVALVPYLFFASVHSAFLGSVIVMAIALFVFGWVKTSLVGETNRWVCLKSGAQMMLLGGVAAGAAMGCVKSFG